jgi:hypothetical protein
MPHVSTPNEETLARVAFQLLCTQIPKDYLWRKNPLLGNEKFLTERTINGYVRYWDEKNGSAEEVSSEMSYEATVVQLHEELLLKGLTIGQYLPSLPKKPNQKFIVLSAIKIHNPTRQSFRTAIGFSIGYAEESSQEVVVVGSCISGIHYHKNQVSTVLTQREQEDFLGHMIEWCQQLLVSVQTGTNFRHIIIEK